MGDISGDFVTVSVPVAFVVIVVHPSAFMCGKPTILSKHGAKMMPNGGRCGRY